MAPASQDGPRRHAPALAALAVAVVVAYAGSFRAGFVFDSRAIILENSRIRAATLANVRLILSEDYWQPLAANGLYRPLATLSYLFNYALLGNADRPSGYHAVNLLLHVACAALVYALLWHLTRRRRPALLAALLFGLHPIATEAVTNLVGRADLLAALGVLGGLLCHVRARGHRGWAWGVLLAAVVAFFSKESGLTLVAALLAYDLVLGGRVRPRDHVLVASVLAVYLAARWWVATSGMPAEDVSPVDNPIVEAGFLAGRATAVEVLGRELHLLLVPVTLSADYSYRQIPVVGWPPGVDWPALAGLSALALLGCAAVRWRRAVPALPFLVVFLVLALLPTSNLVVTIGSIMAERFLYLPLAAFAGALALVAERVAAGRRATLLNAAAAVLLLACAGRTWVRNGDWADELTLWSSTVRAAPESAKAHKGLALALFAAEPRRAHIDRVIAEAERAVALRPDYLPALVDLGSYHLTKGDLLAAQDARQGSARPSYERSVAVLERARALDEASARRFVDKMLTRGHPREAIPDVGSPELYRNLSLAYVRAERLEDALGAYEQSRRLGPTNTVHYLDMSAVLARLGRWEEAAVALFAAVTIDPDQRDAGLRLAEIYRTFYPEGRAVTTDRPDRLVINLDDPTVRNHRCRAFDALVRTYTRARLPDEAARIRALATEVCGRKAARPATHDPSSRNVVADAAGSMTRIARNRGAERGGRGMGST